MTARTFQLSDQIAFAELSGDVNPMHIDPMAARRTLLGRAVVHGIHLVLWSLDQAVGVPAALRRLHVTFSAPVGLGEPVEATINRKSDTQLEIALTSEQRKVCVIKAELAPSRPALPISSSRRRNACRERNVADVPGASGMLAIGLDIAKAAQLFPSLARDLPADQIGLLLATTELVGMECPGLHSIYSELFLIFSDAPDGGDGMTWRVEQFDDRFAEVTMAIESPNAAGRIVAYFRPAPQNQPSGLEIRGCIAPDAFARQRALVIGASRGLGELCAKMLALGGAEVCITYHQGAEDAASVLADIAQYGTGCATQLNALAWPLDLSGLNGWVPTHLYYFPTPPIQTGVRGNFSAMLFDKFCAYYVEGFAQACQALRRLTRAPLKIFYPSTVYVEDVPPNLGEYAAAKSAGEALCRYLQATDGRMDIHVERLPRLPTDQTSNLQNIASGDAVETLAAVLTRTYAASL